MCGGDEPPKHPAARTIEEVIDARVGSPQGAFGFRFPAPRLDCLTNEALEEACEGDRGAFSGGASWPLHSPTATL
jgi:hypothetical protein